MTNGDERQRDHPVGIVVGALLALTLGSGLTFFYPSEWVALCFVACGLSWIAIAGTGWLL